MDNCIFCKIGTKQLPSETVYEDDEIFVIKDINPRAKKHFLVIPKAHYAFLQEMTDEDGAVLGRTLKKIPTIAKDILGLTNGYRLVINQGEDGRQAVMHLHIHILGGEKLPL
jgi:histidine triad (HIT) family protein